MVEIQPAPEGPVDPAMVPSPSPKDADRERRRRRRVLWGAVGVVVVLALLLGVGGVGCGGFVRVWQALRSRPPARLRRSRAPPFRPVLRKVTSCLLAGPSRLNGRTRGRWNRLACMSSRISGSAQCDGGPKEGRQSSMRCIWARASILTAWAPSHLLPSLHRPHPRPIRTRPAEQEKEFTSTSTLTPESNGAGRQTLAEPMKVSGPHELM